MKDNILAAWYHAYCADMGHAAIPSVDLPPAHADQIQAWAHYAFSSPDYEAYVGEGLLLPPVITSLPRVIDNVAQLFSPSSTAGLVAGWHRSGYELNRPFRITTHLDSSDTPRFAVAPISTLRDVENLPTHVPFLLLPLAPTVHPDALEALGFRLHGTAYATSPDHWPGIREGVDRISAAHTQHSDFSLAGPGITATSTHPVLLRAMKRLKSPLPQIIRGATYQHRIHYVATEAEKTQVSSYASSPEGDMIIRLRTPQTERWIISSDLVPESRAAMVLLMGALTRQRPPLDLPEGVEICYRSRGIVLMNHAHHGVELAGIHGLDVISGHDIDGHMLLPAQSGAIIASTRG